jgi:broad-specificity NMP kinase
LGEIETDIPVVEMFRYSTVHSQAEYLSQLSRQEKKKAYSDEKIMENVDSLEESLQLLMGED